MARKLREILEGVKEPTGELKNACWKGYTAVGMKMKNGRKVPNCVPKEETEIEEKYGKGYKSPWDKIEKAKPGIGARIDAHAKELSDLDKEYKKIVDRDKKQVKEETQVSEVSAKFLRRAADAADRDREDMRDYRLSHGDRKVTPDEEKRRKQALKFRVGAVMKNEEEIHECNGNCSCGCKDVDEDKKGHKSPSGGLTQKGRDYYNRTTGSNLKAPVTTEPSKLKKGSKSANRRKSFCARMGGMKKRLTSAKTANDPDSRINKALRKWNC
jgi:hypothetical protein